MKQSIIPRLYLRSFLLPLLLTIVASVIMIFVAPHYQFMVVDYDYYLTELYMVVPTLATAILSSAILLNRFKAVSESPYYFHITWLLIPCIIPSLMIGAVLGDVENAISKAEKLEFLITGVSAVLHLACIVYTFWKYQAQNERNLAQNGN